MRPFRLSLNIKMIDAKMLILESVFASLEGVTSYPFEFSNSNKSFEGGKLKIRDKNEVILERDGIGIISPLERKVIHTEITPESPFIYEIKGKIRDVGIPGKILLDFFTAKYFLEKGEPYYFFIKDRYGETESIEITF